MSAGKAYPIDIETEVLLGGISQSIRIRGTDAANPIILFLHGGPGGPDRHWVLGEQSGLADVCTMVCWDQRGSGKSYSRQQAKRPMSVGDIVNDARELVEWLCTEYSQDKVHIVGHSWGSIVGVLLAQQHPGLIAAYVGVGQVVNIAESELMSYQFVWDEAQRREDKRAIRDLQRIGLPVDGSYQTLGDLMKQRDYMAKFGGGAYNQKQSFLASAVIPVLRSPEYSLVDLYRYCMGSLYSLKALWDEVAATIHFDQTVTRLDVPVILTEGRHDMNTPPSLALRWYEALAVPNKEWIWFEQSGHTPIREQAGLWQEVIRDRLFR